MEVNRIKQILGSEKSKLSTNTDTYLKINLDGEERLLPPGEINKIVNLGDRFNTERQRSTYYRIIGSINPTFTNVLFNLDDNIQSNKDTWSWFDDILFLDTSYPEDNDVVDPTDFTYAQALKASLKERDGWFGYTNPVLSGSGFCSFTDMEPKRERFYFEPDISPYHAPSAPPVKNWELTITYPATSNKTHPMVNGGLLIIDAVPATVSTRSMVAIGMPCKHNLSIGDMVRVTGTTSYDGDHVVVRTGLDNGDLKENYFVIDVLPIGTIGKNSRIKKLFGGVESEYYFRLFTKIATRNTPVIEADDYETYKLAFSENIYNDNISQFVFNEDINVDDLTDNLGRPLSEIYLTVIKTDSNKLFGDVSSGIETSFMPILTTTNVNTYLSDVAAINRIHNGGTTPFVSHTPLESNINVKNKFFYGDLVEFNKNQFLETVLADVHHRFNTLNRETPAQFTYNTTLGSKPQTKTINLGPRQEGYYYKAHHLIKIREFSSYIETGNPIIDEIPSYAIDLGDSRYIWRDLLDIGYNESNDVSLNYPFLNGCHYMYDNYCFFLKRQDPFAKWGLFWTNFPPDPLGEIMTNKFTVKTIDNVC